MRWTWPLLLAAASLSGCASFDETFHFSAQAPGSPWKQYYRVKISGFGLFASSEYASGFYDAAAVDALFGEMAGGRVRLAKPAPEPATEGEGQGRATTPADAASTAPSQVRSLDGESMEAKRLVLFLSSKADGLISQLKSFSTSGDVTAGLTALLLKEDIAAVKTARAGEPARDARAQSFASVLDEAAERLRGVDGASTDDLASTLRQTSLRSIQELARQIEPGVVLADLAAAQAWFMQNQGTLREVLD